MDRPRVCTWFLAKFVTTALGGMLSVFRIFVYNPILLSTMIVAIKKGGFLNGWCYGYRDEYVPGLVALVERFDSFVHSEEGTVGLWAGLTVFFVTHYLLVDRPLLEHARDKLSERRLRNPFHNFDYIRQYVAYQVAKDNSRDGMILCCLVAVLLTLLCVGTAFFGDSVVLRVVFAVNEHILHIALSTYEIFKLCSSLCWDDYESGREAKRIAQLARQPLVSMDENKQVPA